MSPLDKASEASRAPIGIFDSGVGGLSVLREIRALLPCEDLYYLADSAHVPYGAKTADFIRERSGYLSQFLLERRAKAVVIACNTATAAAASLLRERLDIPVVGMEPAVKPAAAATQTGVVGVLATVGTLKSAQYAGLLERFASDVQVITQPCPGLPELVEAGRLDSSETRTLLAGYLRPLLAAGADTIVLGCTHYPFLRPLIRELTGPSITLIDTGAAVAQQLRRVLAAGGLLNPGSQAGTETFWTSGEPGSVQRIVGQVWQRSVEVEALT